MALQFHCQCLNIRIRADRGSILESIENHIDDAVSSDAFFANVIIVVAPAGVEIEKKLPCLSYERLNKNWKINVCLNCGTESHAFSIKGERPLDKIFVSRKMQRNSTTANLISNPKNFSPIYEILIPQQPKDQSASCLPLLPRNQLHNQIEELKAHTIKRLNAENEFLLERIRKFENEQMSLFTELQIQTQRDQNALNQMLINHYSENENGSCESSGESPDVKLRDSKRQKEVSVAAIKPEIEKARSPAPKSRTIPIHDSIFPMDDEELLEEEEEEAPRDGSLLDESETEENQVSDDEAFTMQSDSFKLFATSLPIAMPGMWQSSTRVQEEEDDVRGINCDETKDPTWIAASIQALAMSVRANDGTEMFGARPRPRLNTLD